MVQCLFVSTSDLQISLLLYNPYNWSWLFMQTQCALTENGRNNGTNSSMYLPKLIGLTLGIALLCHGVLFLKEFVGGSRKIWLDEGCIDFKKQPKSIEFSKILYSLLLKVWYTFQENKLLLIIKL